MALTTGPNLGLLVDGNKGEAHYDALMRFLRGLDTLVQPRVSTMTGTLPTTGLVDGLTIVYTGNDTNKNKLARYSTVLAAWEYYSPRGGWEVAVVDQLDENGQFKKYQYTGTDWVEKLTAGGLTLAAGDARYEKLIKHNVTATTDPTVSNDSTEGYAVLSRWVNTTTKESFLALDVAPGAANWQKSTLTVDELGSAALATVGLLDSQIPTVATVKNLLATLAVFGAGSAAAAGTKGLVPAPPQSEVLRFLRSDGVWAFFEIPEGTELSKGANIGEMAGAHGVYLQTIGDTLQFKSLMAADSSIELTSTEGQVRIRAVPQESSVVQPTSVGTGSPVYAGMDGDSPKFRSIKAGENVTVSLDGDDVLISSTGGGTGGGVYEPPVEATPTSVAWTDLGGRISGVSGTPIPSITAFDVSIRQMSMQPMGVLGHATGAKVFWMEDGQERFTNISEMEGLRAERVYAGAEHMFAIRRSDGSLITTYMSADYAWVYPDFGGRLVSTAMHISSGDLWLAGLQSGAICTFGTFPGAPVTDVQASTPAGEIYDFARNPTSGVIIGVGYSRAVRTSDIFANYTMLEFMPFSSEWCIAADDQGRWAMYAMGREEIFYSHDDGETWTEVLLPKMIAKARMQWSGGVFLLSGAAGYEGSDPALFFTSLDGKDWNEIPPYDNTPSYGARIFEENRIMYVGQVWQSDVVQWYEGVVTPGTAGSPGTGTPGSGGQAEDSGWVTLEALNGFPYPPEARKINGVIHLRGFIWIETNFLGEYFARLPQGWLPSSQTYVTRATGARVRRLTIQSKNDWEPGALLVSVMSGDTNADYFEFDCISFPQDARITAGGVGGGSPGGSVTIDNAPGGIPLLETWNTGNPVMRSLVPGNNLAVWSQDDGRVHLSVLDPVRMPTVGFFAIRDPETDTHLWVPSGEDQRLLSTDDPEASIWQYLAKVEGETTVDYVHEAYATYVGSRGTPWWGLRFQIEDRTTWIRVEIQEINADVPGSFDFAVGSSDDPMYRTPIVSMPQGSGGFGPLEFVLEPWNNENMLRVAPPEGSTDFGIRVIVSYAHEPEGVFTQVGTPKIDSPFAGGPDDPSVLENWREFGASGSNGWGASDGWSSTQAPRMRLVFGMVEMLGVVEVSSGSATEVIGTLDWAYAPRKAKDNATNDPEALFPVVVDTAGALSTAYIRVQSTGALVISPVPALGAKVHLTGIRFPSRWPSADPF